MCAGPVFSLVFLSQSCGVFSSCDHQHSDCPHPWFKGAPLLLCCFAIRVCTAKEHVSDHLHALHCHLTLTRLLLLLLLVGLRAAGVPFMFLHVLFLDVVHVLSSFRCHLMLVVDECQQTHQRFSLNGRERTFETGSQLFCCAQISDGNRTVQIDALN